MKRKYLFNIPSEFFTISRDFSEKLLFQTCIDPNSSELEGDSMLFQRTVADNPTNKIKLKTFHCEILNDHRVLQNESKTYYEMRTIGHTTSEMAIQNFRSIKAEISNLIETEIERILNTPGIDKITN